MADLYDRAILVFGVESQKRKAIEELSELIRAIVRGDDIENIIEEIADVEIMCEQIARIYDIPSMQQLRMKRYKLKRLERLVDEKIK